MKRLEFIEIDIDYCSLDYGVLPCAASGSVKCFNTKATCQARPSYDNEIITLRFAVGSSYLNESNIDIIAPCIESISYSAGEISIGENLGRRSSLNIQFSDFKSTDSQKGMDKYFRERGYDPFDVGTFWGKFSARHRFLRGRPLRWYQGELGQPLEAMEVRHFIVDNFDGPTLDGRFNITAKDILKLADNDRVKVPLASRGYLLGDITDTQTSFTIGPVGIGNIGYPSAGYINIAGREICTFTRSGDVFTIVRGMEGTINTEHKAQDRVQLCQAYEGMDPSEVIRDLLVTYAGIPSEFIPLDDWISETDSFLRRRYTRIIAEPTGVAKVINELIQQAGLIVWWDEVTKLIRLKVIREIDTDVESYNDSNVLVGTFRQRERPDTRISQVMTYFGARSPLANVTEPTSYHSLQLDVNLEAESDYGSSVVKTIHSSWIPQFGRTVAQRLNSRLLGRFVNPPREFSFETLRSRDIVPPLIGEGYRLSSRALQDASGGAIGIPVQITKVTPKPEGFSVSAMEMQFTEFSEEDLDDRTIIIDGDFLNFNWRVAYDRLFPPARPTDDIVCIVSEGAVVGSQIAGRAAFIVGDWPAGINLRLIIRGRIQGKGGDGGWGDAGQEAARGQDGGLALYTRYPVKVEQSHQIWGGGGGGAGRRGKYGKGGSGGQGFVPGLGGAGNTRPEHNNNGTKEAPGVSKWGDTGTGGAAGMPGGNTSSSPGPAYGGAAGRSIDGFSFLTFTNGQGDIRGPRIN